MILNRIFYTLKPAIPRRLQIFLRRKIALYKRKKYSHIWPIDPNAGDPPEGWKGWPDGKKFALVLTHDVDTRRGYERCRNLIGLEEKMGFRSSFNFVPQKYHVSEALRNYIVEKGFEVGVHGLKHDGKLCSSKTIFQERATKINNYLHDWQCKGFRSPAMHCNLEWFHDLDIDYDASTFDTDPFEPQPNGVGTIYPYWISNSHFKTRYLELPYTLVQDFTLFIILNEKSTDIWTLKLNWIAENGGMALINTHPDYMNFNANKNYLEEYPIEYYVEFLSYIKNKYAGRFWNALPRDIFEFFKNLK